MTVLRSLLVALTALVCWYLVVASTPAIHQAIFRMVPPDGLLTQEERVAIDNDVTAFIRYLPPIGDRSLPTFYKQVSATEVEHLEDVFALNSLILLYLLPALLVGLLLSKIWKLTLRDSAWSMVVIGILGLVSVTMFEPLFLGIHPWLFPQGNWLLPTDRFVLTQVYPEQFFALIWAGIVALSLLSIGIVHLALRKRQA